MTTDKTLSTFPVILIVLFSSISLLGCAGRAQAVTLTSVGDGKVMVKIPAGAFQMGLSVEQATNLARQADLGRNVWKDESPQSSLSLPDFYIDQTPVTNAEYKRFLDAHADRSVPYVDDILLRGYNWDKATRAFPEHAWRSRRPSGMERCRRLLPMGRQTPAHGSGMGKGGTGHGRQAVAVGQ